MQPLLPLREISDQFRSQFTQQFSKHTIFRSNFLFDALAQPACQRWAVSTGGDGQAYFASSHYCR